LLGDGNLFLHWAAFENVDGNVNVLLQKHQHGQLDFNCTFVHFCLLQYC